MRGEMPFKITPRMVFCSNCKKPRSSAASVSDMPLAETTSTVGDCVSRAMSAVEFSLLVPASPS